MRARDDDALPCLARTSRAREGGVQWPEVAAQRPWEPLPCSEHVVPVQRGNHAMHTVPLVDAAAFVTVNGYASHVLTQRLGPPAFPVRADAGVGDERDPRRQVGEVQPHGVMYAETATGHVDAASRTVRPGCNGCTERGEAQGTCRSRAGFSTARHFARHVLDRGSRFRHGVPRRPRCSHLTRTPGATPCRRRSHTIPCRQSTSHETRWLAESLDGTTCGATKRQPARPIDLGPQPRPRSESRSTTRRGASNQRSRSRFSTCDAMRSACSKP